MIDQPTQPTNGGTLAYRVGRLEQDHRDHIEDYDDLEERVRELERELGKLQERMTMFQAAQAIFTTIAGTVAAFIGRIP
jgi:prefoldin subunit 5